MLKRLKLIFPLLLIILLIVLIFPRRADAVVLFQDDFNDGDASDWIVARNMQWNNQSESCYFNGQPANWQVVDGKYGIVIDGKPCVTESMPIDQLWDNSWNNYIFESDITFIEGVDANIAFRYSKDTTRSI